MMKPFCILFGMMLFTANTFATSFQDKLNELETIKIEPILYNGMPIDATSITICRILGYHVSVTREYGPKEQSSYYGIQHLNQDAFTLYKGEGPIEKSFLKSVTCAR
ncbi:MAG: hypothetical protein R3B45_09515 [Bdellovibrionota bacterium]